MANDHTGGADNNGISFFYGSGNQNMNNEIGNGTASINASTSASTFPVNAWTMATVTYDGTSAISYSGTTARSTFTLAGPIATPTNPLGFCYNPEYSGDFFAGKIAGIAIYNRARSSSEIATINGL